MSVSACLLVLVCQVQATSSQVKVQGSPPFDIQATLDALPSGASYSVPSGDYTRTVLRKPLTLIGQDPRPNFEELVLEGASGGRLTLVNLRTDADLSGTGFDELRLFDVEVVANRVSVTGLSYLELTRLAFTPNSLGAVEAPGASVVLLDSVAGSLAGARLYQAGSACPMLAPTEFEKTLQNDLVLQQPVRLGRTVTLSWSIPSPVALLVARARTQAPIRVPRSTSGAWHLAGSRWMTATVVSPGSLALQVPPDPSLFGGQIAFQVIGPNRYLSRPASAIIR